VQTAETPPLYETPDQTGVINATPPRFPDPDRTTGIEPRVRRSLEASSTVCHAPCNLISVLNLFMSGNNPSVAANI
jgi:hypothetical protein